MLSNGQSGKDKVNPGLQKSKDQILNKSNDMIAQLQKLRGYIITNDGEYLVEFKDKATGDSAIKSIDDAIVALQNLNKSIDDAKTNQELKSLTSNLEKNWLKNQVFMKRITGLTSAARFKTAYDQTKVLVDKLGIGVKSMPGDSTKVQAAELTMDYSAIESKLESSRRQYLDAVNLYSSITDAKNADKSYKDANTKLQTAQKELNECLVKAKQLLTKIKVEVKARSGKSN